MMRGRPWMTSDTKALKSLWAKGLMASEIAPLINRSRSAVLGRLKRLGLLGITNGEFRRRCSRAAHRSWGTDRVVTDESRRNMSRAAHERWGTERTVTEDHQ